MAGHDKNNGNGYKWTALLVAAIGALVGGSGSTYLVLSRGDLQGMARPDPFTGTDGSFLEQRLSKVERQVDQLPPRELELEVGLLRHDLNDLERRIEDLEDSR